MVTPTVKIIADFEQRKIHIIYTKSPYIIEQSEYSVRFLETHIGPFFSGPLLIQMVTQKSCTSASTFRLWENVLSATRWCIMSHAKETMEMICSFFDEQILSISLWPPGSPDMSPCDYFLWRYLKGKVYHRNPSTINEFRINIQMIIEQIFPSMQLPVFADESNCAFRWAANILVIYYNLQPCVLLCYS